MNGNVKETYSVITFFLHGENNTHCWTALVSCITVNYDVAYLLAKIKIKIWRIVYKLLELVFT